MGVLIEELQESEEWYHISDKYDPLSNYYSSLFELEG